jgi:hypothetical protein
VALVKDFVVNLSVEDTRDRFYKELVQRGSGTVGLEMNLAGFVDARRRFVLAIQGWENTVWMRPLLTRLEGHFERSEDNTYTKVVFERRGLSLPLFVLSLLLPYTVARLMIPELPPTLYQIVVVGVSLALVVIGSIALAIVERRVHKLLERGLVTIYDLNVEDV